MGLGLGVCLLLGVQGELQAARLLDTHDERRRGGEQGDGAARAPELELPPRHLVRHLVGGRRRLRARPRARVRARGRARARARARVRGQK